MTDSKGKECYIRYKVGRAGGMFGTLLSVFCAGAVAGNKEYIADRIKAAEKYPFHQDKYML